MHPAAKRLQARLRKLSEEAGAADEFSDSEVGEARTTVGVVNVKKCLLSPSLDDQDEFECTLDWRVESGTQPSPHFLHQPTEIRMKATGLLSCLLNTGTQLYTYIRLNVKLGERGPVQW